MAPKSGTDNVAQYVAISNSEQPDYRDMVQREKAEERESRRRTA